jgi:uncharacterized protein (TIGR04255 family)
MAGGLGFPDMADVIFQHPPVVEVILGVQFAPIAGLTNAHLGWFWREYLGKNWPKSSNAPPIPDEFETFKDQPSWGSLGIRFGIMDGSETGRSQFSTAAGEHLVQVQPSRFHVNWQKREQKYPRYLAVKKEFWEHFNTFKRFLADAGLDEVRPNQWEVTYVNHVPQGTLWNQPSDLDKILVNLSPQGSVPGQRLDGVNGIWRFEITPQRGRVHLTVQSAQAGTPPKPVLVLNITARGPVHPEKGDLDAGLDIGHEAALTNFFGLTTPAARAAWIPVPI